MDQRNRFDRREWAGAFGDLGTLIPFVVAYVNLLGLNPGGVLLGFGLAQIVSGALYRIPFPVQPMKALGAAAIAQATFGFTVTPGAVFAAGLVSGAVWLVLGASGLASRLARLVPASVVAGLILGLGVVFMIKGLGMAMDRLWLAALAAVAAIALLNNRRLPAMFVLLLIGAVAATIAHPAPFTDLQWIKPTLRLPAWELGSIGLNDVLGGTLLLALPQLPLTLGNAVIAVSAETRRLFPHRPVSESRAAVSNGVLNLAAPLIGGVPMCHGAGGLAGHVRFGARTGGALIILGTLLVVLALFYSHSLIAALGAFPPAVLGVILFIAGTELARGAQFPQGRGDQIITLATAACALWNVGAAFVVGIGLHHAMRWFGNSGSQQR